MTRTRDDFTQRTKDTLAKRAGFLCSNPNCRAPTSGPSNGTVSGTVNVGVAAHIKAAAAGGPRYDPRQTPAQRTSLTNGLWLCENCATRIDRDPNAYPVKMLYEWKDAAERYASASLGVPNYARRGASIGGASILIEHRNYAPFAFAFEEDEIPEYYFGLSRWDIPVDWRGTWVDVLKMRVTVSNPSEAGPVVIDDMGVDVEVLGEEYSSAIQYIPQGASSAVELLSVVLDGIVSISHIERDWPNSKVLRREFFRSGGRIEVRPGTTETLLVSFVVDRPYLLHPYMEIVENGSRKVLHLPDERGVKLVPSTSIPESGRRWSIHYDGRVHGIGFERDNLDGFRDCLAELGFGPRADNLETAEERLEA